jgi:hypothetical protein
MVVNTEGAGDRSLFVSYISEVPVWKATYRIVLDTKRDPLLQGWAIVDNIVGQDWENVQLSLIAGAPQSFVQDLATPLYARRPIVPVAATASSAPQTHESTLISGNGRLTGIITDSTGTGVAGAKVTLRDSSGSLLRTIAADAFGAYSFSNLPERAFRLEIEASGFKTSVVNSIDLTRGAPAKQDVRLEIGSVSETVAVSSGLTRYEMMGMTTRADRFSRSDRLQSSPQPPSLASRLSAIPAASSAQDLGDLFEYKLKEPITVRKNRSALVPIVNASIGAEKVSIWNEQSGHRRPQRALWLTNTSGLTLDGGTFNVIEEDTFAGEGLLDPIKPGEKRLLSYATDLALTAGSKFDNQSRRVTRVVVRHGAMIHESELVEKKTYTFRNEDSKPRSVLIEHPVRPDFELRGGIEPEETTATWRRFRLPVPAKQTASLTVEEMRSLDVTYALSAITPDQVALFVSDKSINKPIEDALRRILAQKDAISAIADRREERESQSTGIVSDQQRLRENMKALKASLEEKALLARYTRQLGEQETQLQSLRKEVQNLAAEEEAAEKALEEMIAQLSFDIRL